MAGKKTCSSCGFKVEPDAKFCSECGAAAASMVACPVCRQEVDLANFCSECGADLQYTPNGPQFDGAVWARGEEDFAVNVSSEMINMVHGSAVEVRHGTKAIFFEEGRLVEIAESGRYTTQKDGFLNKLLQRKSGISAVLVEKYGWEIVKKLLDACKRGLDFSHRPTRTNTDRVLKKL